MSNEYQYRITFPKTSVLFDSTDLTFSIGAIKSRLTSTLFFRIHFFDKTDTDFYTYTSPRWVIDTEYRKRTRTFQITDDVLEKATYVQIELFAIGINSENPLYFTEVLFCEGLDDTYSPPNYKPSQVIGFVNNSYANLYSYDGTYLQVIRPQRDGFKNDCLTKSTCTVIAPHLTSETDVDDPINIFLEFINQTEQRIDVLR